MSFDPQQQLTTTALGDPKSEEKTPITQISAEYGITGQVLETVDVLASGSTSVVDNKFTCETGTSPGGLASILSVRQLKYRAGQGALGIVDAVFSPGVAGSVQLAGLITAENTYAFSFIGTAFAIAFFHDGEAENQELTISVAGTGVATITVDGTGFPVTLTAGTAQHNAFEISNSLNAQVPNYIFTSNDNQVVAQSLESRPMGAFAFSGSTATAAWVQITEALTPITEIIVQSDWNRDTRISTDPKLNLDPLQGNTYQIQCQYGFGGINFFVLDKVSNNFVLVHVIEFANFSTLPSVTNPTFRIGWAVRNVGGTTNVTISGSTASAFVEGKIKITTPTESEDFDQLNVGTTLTNIISFRNRTHFAGKVNRSEIFPLTVSLSTQTNKNAFFEILVDPSFGGDLDFDYVDKQNSTMEIATDSVPVSGGKKIDSKTVGANSQGGIIFNVREDSELVQLPGQTFTIACRIGTGAASDCQATGTWQEDK